MKKGIKTFLIYHLRWQLGLVLTPVMMLFIDYFHLKTWIALILFNLVGATIFFPVDKYIFARKRKDNQESEQSEAKEK